MSRNPIRAVLAGLMFVMMSACALSQQAQKNVAYYDTKYPVKWMSRAAAEEVKDFLTSLGFEPFGAAGLKTWMETKIGAGAAGSLLVMAQDVAPSTVVGPAPGPDALFRKYLDAGGTVIWIADVPFYFIGYEGDKTEKWDYLGGRGVLGFDTVGNWQGRSEAGAAGLGARWGLKKKWISVRAVKPEDITEKLAADADGNASAWIKKFAEGSAGFVRLWDYSMKNFTDEMGEDLYRVLSNISDDFGAERRSGNIYLFQPSEYRPLVHREGDVLFRETQITVFDNSPGPKNYRLDITKENARLHSMKLFDDERSFFKKNIDVPLFFADQKLALVSTSGGESRVVDEKTLNENPVFMDLKWEARPLRNPVDMGSVLVPGNRLLIAIDQSLHVDISAMLFGAGGDSLPVEMKLNIVDRDSRVLTSIDQVEEITPGRMYRMALETAPGRMITGKYRADFEASIAGRQVFKESRWLLVREYTPPPIEFGAYEADLGYDGPVMSYNRETEEWSRLKWDDLWLRGPHNDIVVAFPNRTRFVFWRGSSNVPFWASVSNVGLTYEWLEAAWGRGGLVDCIEPLQDKKCMYSRPYIVSSNQARAIVRWRYALIDLEYTIADEEWAEEEFVFYPDGFGVRKATGHFLPMTWHEANEFIVFTPAAVNPFDILPRKAVTILSPDGLKKDYITYPQPGTEWEKDTPAVFRINYSRTDPYTPIMATRNFDHFVVQYDGWKVDGRYISPSYWGVHYPVTRGYPTTVTPPPMWRESAAHASLTAVESTPLNRKYIDKNHEIVTWAWLIGNTNLSDEELLPKVRNWIEPAAMKVISGGAGGNYDAAQRAYRIEIKQDEMFTAQLEGAPHASISNTVILIENCGISAPRIWINGQRISDREFKFAIEKEWLMTTGVIWLARSIPANSKIEIK